MQSKEDANGGQELLVRYINVLIDDGDVKAMAVQTLNTLGLLVTSAEISLLGRRNSNHMNIM